MAEGQKTEAPSARRLHELRQKGQVTRSMDLTTAIGLLAGLFVLQQSGAEAVARMRSYMVDELSSLSRVELTDTTVNHLMGSGGSVMIAALVPMFVALPILAIVTTLAQTGPLMTGYGLTPHADRINPVSAFKRLFSLRSLAELAKATAKFGVVTFLVWRIYAESTQQMLALGSTDVRSSVAMLVDIGMRMSMTAAVALLALAALDYAYQRWEFQRSAMMTKDELKEEVKQSEGSPQTRARIRSLQRRMARSRMMQDVPTADVVITNPTHLAVALSYRSDEMGAPRVVAKGADFLAQRIREVATESGVPIVENKPLAQAIYRTVQVGAEVPTTLFQAVAEVLAYIYTLRGRHPMMGGPRGS